MTVHWTCCVEESVVEGIFIKAYDLLGGYGSCGVNGSLGVYDLLGVYDSLGLYSSLRVHPEPHRL